MKNRTLAGRSDASPSQEKAIRHKCGPALVLAGPGSGKTFVITHRIQYLIQNCGVMPEEILVITFSKAASVQMRDRYTALTQDRSGKIVFGTFHAVFFQILKKTYHYSSSDIISDETKNRILAGLAAAEGFCRADTAELLPALSAEISAVKNEQIPLPHFYSSCCDEESFRRICSGYQKEIQRQGLIDFDDMLVLCYKLLRERKDILALWQQRFRYILVDEFQDINRIQYETLKLLSAPCMNLFAVGDDDQSIYRFRGAKPEIMLGFEKDFPQAKVLRLEENFRSASVIIRIAGCVISENKNRFEKDIRQAGSGCAGDAFVRIRSFSDLKQEAQYMIRRFRELAGEGNALRETAVLTRTRNEGRYFAQQFLSCQIPIMMSELTPGLYDHWITADILAYVRMAEGGRERSDFLRVMNRPLRYLNRSCADRRQIDFQRLQLLYEDKPWMKERIALLEKDLVIAGKLRPYAAIQYIRKQIGYDDFVRKYAAGKGIDPEELMQILDELLESALSCKTLPEWREKIREDRAKLQAQIEKQKKSRTEGEEKEDAVFIATLHASKGLEFEEVFIPNVNEGTIPWRKARKQADLEEERRLLYVGMTRAKKRLHLCWVRESFGKKAKPSPFLRCLSD